MTPRSSRSCVCYYYPLERAGRKVLFFFLLFRTSNSTVKEKPAAKIICAESPCVAAPFQLFRSIPIAVPATFCLSSSLRKKKGSTHAYMYDATVGFPQLCSTVPPLFLVFFFLLVCFLFLITVLPALSLTLCRPRKKKELCLFYRSCLCNVSSYLCLTEIKSSYFLKCVSSAVCSHRKLSLLLFYCRRARLYQGANAFGALMLIIAPFFFFAAHAHFVVICFSHFFALFFFFF